MPITLKDIADRTGVSPSVVSTVLSGRDNGTFVSKDTRERVLRVAQELNYTPVRSGRPRGSRRLRRQRVDQFIGVWSPDMEPASAQTLDALQQALHQYAEEHASYAENDYDYGLRLLSSDDLPRLDMLGVMGLIVIGDVSLPRVAAAANTPTILMGEVEQSSAELITVHLDNFAAGRALGEHLWQLGHRRVAFLAPSAKPRATKQRWNGLLSVWVEHGLPKEVNVPAPYDLLPDLNLREQILRAVTGLFAGNSVPTALACFNETVAIYALQSLVKLDKYVPDDVSLVTFGDTPNGAEAQAIPLTAIRPPVKQLAATAIAQLYHLSHEAETPSSEATDPGRRDLAFPGELIVRESSGPPPVPAAPS